MGRATFRITGHIGLVALDDRLGLKSWRADLLVMTDFELLRRQGWTADDLQANHVGRLSPLQVTVLRSRMRLYLLMSLIWAVPIPLLALAGAVYGLLAKHEPGYFVFPVMAAAAFSILPIYVGNRVHMVNTDLAADRVECAEGVIDGLFVNNASGQTRARMGNAVMLCFGSVWDAGWREGVRFLAGAHATRTPIRAYYLPWSQLLVAAEAWPAGQSGLRQ
jgi:hypothetical protein